ncbi:RraA family protein [uncultured Microbacterium sp.]|uniref:RraA family protein n=1 Tax=uncultured Microbacterium sp. TaxID=191216 RepID=UPI0026297787|nr:RraA family protein [uncultured Microbacterium sp.]
MDMNVIVVRPAASAVGPDLIARYRKLPTAAISDSMRRTPGVIGLNIIGNSLRHGEHPSMVGTALTVRTRPGDNLAVHVALDRGRVDDILVVDARGDVTNAILGELMTAYAQSRGFSGIIVDGAVRDHDEISAGSMPVYARGLSHLGPYKSGPGEVHVPASIGGIAVNDGDLIVGDADGIAVIPAADADEVAERAEAIVQSEIVQRAQIDAHEWDRTWIDRTAVVLEVGEE